jgi:hypothetical protein
MRKAPSRRAVTAAVRVCGLGLSTVPGYTQRIQRLTNGLATGPEVLNDPFFPGGLTMGNPKITIVAYCVAAGFILAVAFHSSSKTQITASSMPAVTPISDIK